jgi:hypothetical protein
MNNQRWLNRSQPPYLQNATILFYINAAFALISFGSDPFFMLKLFGLGAGFGIANDKKWGYILGAVVAIIPLVVTLSWIVGGHFNSYTFFDLIISLMFQILLIVFLFHPISRNYQRIWFK